MRYRLRQLQLVLLFYRSVAPALLLVSAALLLGVLVPGLLEGWVAGVPLGLVLAKLLTVPAAWYLHDQLRPDQYWLSYNLGLARRWLWLGVAALDSLVFLAAAEATVALLQ